MPEEIEELEDGVEQEAPESNVIDASDKFTNDNNDVDDFRHSDILKKDSESTTNLDNTNTDSLALNNNQNKESNIIDFNSGYNKAINGKEAFSRKINDRDYYNKETSELKNKIDDTKKKIGNNNQQIDDNNKKIEEQNNQNNNSSSDINNDVKTGDLKQRTEDKSKSEDGEKQVQNKSDNTESISDLVNKNKQLSKENKELEKSIKKGEKDLKAISKDEKKAKRFAIAHPIEAAKMLIKKFLLKKLVVGGIVVLLVIIGICFVIESIYEVFDNVDKVVKGAANFHEKLDNFVNGLGFYDSEQAFYKELNNINKYYENQLDTQLLMATIFYDDIENGLDADSNEKEYGLLEEYDGNTIFSFGMVFDYMKSVVDESNQTIGKDGIIYTSNKIYRLRRLANNQLKFNGTNTSTIPINDYIGKKLVSLGKSSLAIFKEIGSLSIQTILEPLGIANSAESLYQVLYDGENFFMTDVGAHFDNIAISAKQIGNTLLNIFKAEIEVGCSGGVICVKYDRGTVDKDAYYKYLKEKYIPKMPEFDKYINGLSGEEYDREIDRIINRIYEIAENYDEYFGEQKGEETAEFYAQGYQGNIKAAALADLRKPVDIKEDTKVNFGGVYAYGTADGLFHNGIDFNSETTGSKEGDPVYSIYSNGVVEESTFDKSFTGCEECTGAWVKIRYVIEKNDTKYDLSATYGGLDPSSFSLKKGDTVGKDQVIGKIGNAEQSEDGKIASVHFSLYDNSVASASASSAYLNPVGMFASNAEIVGNSLVEKVWWAIVDAGLGKYCAAGVLGNISYESGGKEIRGNAKSLECRPKNEGGCKNRYTLEEVLNSKTLGLGTKGLGIVGWSIDGWKWGLIEFAEYKGVPWYDEDLQVEFLVKTITATASARNESVPKWERIYHLTHNYRNGKHYYWSSFINAKSPEEAGFHFWGTYENSFNNTSVERGNMARVIYEKFKDMPHP